MTWSPDFIGIGAEKSATTWAWAVLNQHPSIGMSQPKELNYFNDHFDRGPDWYRSFFRYDAAHQKCGEISPLYMDHPETARRIAEVCPASRILVMLRNPFDRAISHMFHDAQNVVGRMDHVTADMLKTFAARDDKYLRRSLYGQQLQPFFELLDPARIGVFFFEDVRHRSQELTAALYTFAGVDPAFQPAARDERINPSTDFRFVRLTKGLIRLSRAAKAFPPTRMAMQWVYRNTSFRERTIQALSVDRGRPEISFADVFTDREIDLVYNDLQLLDQLIPNGCPEFWADGSPEMPRTQRNSELTRPSGVRTENLSALGHGSALPGGDTDRRAA